MKETVLLKEVWVSADKPFTFTEKVDPRDGQKKFIMRGLMLPFGKISRNNVLYDQNSIIEKHKQLVGRPVMYNHDIESDALPVGHFINSYVITEADSTHPVPGWYYEADIDPEERDFIRKLKRQDLRHVSIQLTGGKVFERIDTDTGSPYTEAHVADIIEGSIVPAPGFLDTTAQFAEALHPERMKEYTSGAGAQIPDTQSGKDEMSQEKMSDAEKTKEEKTMAKKRLKENEAEVDSQAPAAAGGDEKTPNPLTPDKVGQDETTEQRMKENDAEMDTQDSPKAGADEKTPNPLTPEDVGQDMPTDARSPNAKMEALEDENEDLKKEMKRLRNALKEMASEEEEDEMSESAEEDEDKSMMERFREEYEDDMGKMTDIVERLKEQIDDLKDKVEQMSSSDEEEEEMEEADEPQPPMTESARLSQIFSEGVKPRDNDKEFNRAVRKVLYG